MKDRSDSAPNPYRSSWRTQPRAKTPASTKAATKGVSVVYYIRLDGGLVKIGTTTNLMERIRHAGLPGMRNKDRVLAVEFGGRDLERERHAEFNHLRVAGAGETFQPGGDLLAHIERLRDALGIAP